MRIEEDGRNLHHLCQQKEGFRRQYRFYHMLNLGLGRNKLMSCLASHGENVDAGFGKIIYYLFLDEINQKCASLR